MSIQTFAEAYNPSLEAVRKFLPAIVDAAYKPTRAEIDGGTNLTEDIVAMAGWTVEPATAAVRRVGRRVDSQVDARTTLPTCTITVVADRDPAKDIRAKLQVGQTGFLWFAESGDREGAVADVWSVRVASINKPYRTDDGEQQIVVTFTVRDEPAYDVEIPAPAAG